MKKLPGTQLSRNEMKKIAGGGVAQTITCSCKPKGLCPLNLIDRTVVCPTAIHVCCLPW